MTQTRRSFLAHAAAGAGVITILPHVSFAQNQMVHSFMDGKVTVHPVAHASFVMEAPVGVIYVDPVGAAADYADMPAADLVLVTHEHGDHYNADVLSAVKGDAPLITNPAVYEMLPEGLKSGAMALANGESHDWMGLTIDAIPAHNTTEGRMNFHPKGRDNGYVLTMDGFKTYISGDTEPTPEMLSLTDVDLCFLCMNLPFTMTAEQAAAAVAAFKPAFVLPYHFRGRDGGTQDPAHFAELVGADAEVVIAKWYAPGELG